MPFLVIFLLSFGFARVVVARLGRELAHDRAGACLLLVFAVLAVLTCTRPQSRRCVDHAVGARERATGAKTGLVHALVVIVLACGVCPMVHAESRRIAYDTTPQSSVAESLERHFEEASRRYALPVCFLRAVARVESGFDPRIVSRRGAMGVMQLMPKTARAMGVRNPYDARENILGGARYLRVLANQWKGDFVLTVASYNAGPTVVGRCRCVPPYPETRGYVVRVLKHYQAYQRGETLAQR